MKLNSVSNKIAVLRIEDKVNRYTFNETEKLVWDYGKYVALRENSASYSGSNFEVYNSICLKNWRKMKELGCYVDVEGSELKPEYREIYYEAMESFIRSY